MARFKCAIKGAMLINVGGKTKLAALLTHLEISYDVIEHPVQLMG